MYTLLFDFDGTIADSLEHFIKTVGVLSTKYKLRQLSKDEIEKLRAQHPRAIIKLLQIPFYKMPLIIRDMKRIQANEMAEIQPITGLIAVLKELKNRGYSLGIITSNSRQNVELFLRNNGIDIFDFIYGDIGMFGKHKMIQSVIRTRKIDLSRVVYIGDEIRDIEASKKAGVRIASVTWGLNSKAGLIQYNPDYLISKPEELLHLFQGEKAKDL